MPEFTIWERLSIFASGMLPMWVVRRRMIRDFVRLGLTRKDAVKTVRELTK